MITLYVKIHNITGLKYFGKTVKNPYTYKGSGIYWKKHIKKHGDNISTIIVGEYFKDSELLTLHSLNFSTIYDIVRSSEWANLINENGSDGNCPGTVFSQETRNKIGTSSKGRVPPIKGQSYKEYFGKDKALNIITKMKSSNYHSAKTYEERFGVERANTLKAARTQKILGSNNPNSAIWELYCPNGNTEIITELTNRLKELNLPYGTIKDSFIYNRAVTRGIAKGYKLEKQI